MKIIKSINPKAKKTATINIPKPMFKALKDINKKYKCKNMHQLLMCIIADILNNEGYSDDDLQIIRKEV